MEKTGLDGGKFTIGLAALDADGDGLPDVYVGNYLDTDSLRESKAPGTSFMTPDEYKGQDNQLLRNLGAWKFADVTDASGAKDPGSKTIGAVALDYDGDGMTDLYVANDQWRNTLFHNEGGGVFRDVSDETGTGYPEEGSVTAFGRKTRSGMGLVATDLDGDGRPDLCVTNYANEPDTLYRNVEGAVFAESEREAFGGDHDPVLPLSKWGVASLDFDNDGKDDLAVSSGQILSRFFTVVGQWFNPKAKNFAVGEKSYAQRQFLFRNESAPGTMAFRDVSAASGDLGRLCVVGRGLSAGDLDGDGREDLVFNPIDAPAIVLRNTAPGGNALEILPVAGADRKTVLGTRVTVVRGRGEGQGVLRRPVLRERLVAAASLRPRDGRLRARRREMAGRRDAGSRGRPEGRVEAEKGRDARASAAGTPVRPGSRRGRCGPGRRAARHAMVRPLGAHEKVPRLRLSRVTHLGPGARSGSSGDDESREALHGKPLEELRDLRLVAPVLAHAVHDDDGDEVLVQVPRAFVRRRRLPGAAAGRGRTSPP